MGTGEGEGERGGSSSPASSEFSAAPLRFPRKLPPPLMRRGELLKEAEGSLPRLQKPWKTEVGGYVRVGAQGEG